MYRPRLLARVTNWLVMPPPTPISSHALLDQAGRAFAASDAASGPIAYLTVIARRFAHEQVAFHAAASLRDDAGTIDSAAGIAIMGRVERELALPDADGTLVSWRTHAHATGTAWAAAVVRRDDVVWEITASGRHTRELVAAVVALAATLSVRAGDTPLPDLIPVPDDLPEPMRLDAVISLNDDVVLAA